MALISEIWAYFKGRGLRPKPSLNIGELVHEHEGPFLQRNCWRTFLFLGTEGLEIVNNRGNNHSQRERTFIKYSEIQEAWTVDLGPGLPRDIRITGTNGKEIGRFVDPDPDAVDSIIEQIRDLTVRSTGPQSHWLGPPSSS